MRGINSGLYGLLRAARYSIFIDHDLLKLLVNLLHGNHTFWFKIEDFKNIFFKHFSYLIVSKVAPV